MKHSQLHSVAHNFADSLAGGVSFITGCFDLDVFGVAASDPDGVVVIDFLTGSLEGEVEDAKLEAAIPLFRSAFPGFCEKHGVNVSDYRELSVRYMAHRMGPAYVVTITDRNGKSSSREYVGNPGSRPTVVDDLGRRRPKPYPRPPGN